ncbi:MAG: protease modulator HflC [Zoogloeaceae bacterium]|jgi:membrane protease subunit HflC|nr:protease modulator HflC [Zoogloeaceae bacterium]
MKVHLQLLGVFIALALLFASMSFFTVDQRKYALVLQLGEVKRVIKAPGLHFKWPLIQNVRFFDNRILTFDSAEPELFITSEKKNVQVDSYVKWRVIDPRLYYMSVNGDESRASIRLAQTINDGLRAEFGQRTVHDVVSGERNKIMEEMRGKANLDAKKIGVEVIDVRLKRVELPPNVSDNVYERMRSERRQAANRLRAEGEKEAERIRAEAYREAEKVKGEGDARAAAIYAQAYNQNPEFYAFYRSLEAYRNSFSTKQDLLVVEPGSDFFRYLKNAK